MDFDAFIGQGWDDHVKDASGVAARLQTDGIALLSEARQIVPLAHLAHHVMGEHLGRWQDGLQFQQQLAALPLCQPGSAEAQALGRFMASLQLASGAMDAVDLRSTLSPSDAIRVTAMAAASLAGQDTARALALFQDALAQADRAALPDTDPCTRALAVSGNNLASTLEENNSRSAEERSLMILAAQTARRYWGIAGGWLETERAEHRLAMTWLQAGDPVQARVHAQNCLDIVAAHEGAALERFFGWDALGRADRAAGHAAGHAQALSQAEAAFEALEPGDRGWCQASLDALRTPPG